MLPRRFRQEMRASLAKDVEVAAHRVNAALGELLSLLADVYRGGDTTARILAQFALHSDGIYVTDLVHLRRL